jgi:VanZ family protein
VLKYFFLACAICWTFLILMLCLENEKEIPDIEIKHLDKVVHFVFHFIFSTLWFLYFKKRFLQITNSRLLVSTWLFSLVFGLVIEFLQQQITTTRNADVIDVLSNAIGATVAVCAFYYSRFLQKF